MGVAAKLKMQERLAIQARPLTRRGDRQKARGPVLVQSSHGDGAQAQLNDISTYGCNLLVSANWLRIGGFIAIEVSQGRTIQAIVRWIRGSSCGVEFLRPIPDAEADSLAEQWD